ncbi:MFS transporter [Reticulibacter mediterranei]|uniref:MFS transporter n=1 Tax=Reticulibacter mediterranei TaxID=2778369 RepID=A0A8J3N082_9CHLR|nr:MFS transporter [Reticulibacter mediterranei]GHO91238.1 MFS transporter [Reticulibacter mediterranei]
MEATHAGKLRSDFWKYWTGQTISNLGSSITLFALPLLVYKLTGSSINLGISTAANFLPYLLFGLLLGAWTDRVDRKRMMIFTDGARAVVIALIPILALSGSLNVWWIYAVGFVHSILTICFESGQFAAIPSLVNQDDLVTANGRIQASYSGASILGPLLAGALVTIMSLQMLMFLDAASFLLSALSLSLIATGFNQQQSQERKHIWHDVSEGLRYVLGHPVLRNISIMMALVNFTAVTVAAQIVLFAQERLHATDTQISILYAAGSIGVVVLSLAAGPLRKRWSFSTVALTALMIEGLLTVALAFTQWYWLGVLLWGIASGLGILFNINTSSLRQAIVPNHMLGRVMSIASVLAWSAIPVGSLLGGYAVGWTQNIVLVYAVIGIVMFLIPLCFSFTALGRANDYIQQATEQERTTDAAAPDKA